MVGHWFRLIVFNKSKARKVAVLLWVRGLQLGQRQTELSGNIALFGSILLEP